MTRPREEERAPAAAPIVAPLPQMMRVAGAALTRVGWCVCTETLCKLALGLHESFIF